MMSNQQLASEINEAEVSMIILPKESYSEQIINLMKVVTENYLKICYITINKSCATLTKEFEKHQIDTTKLVFIDASPGDHKKRAQKGKYVFIESAGNLTQISIEFSKFLNMMKINNSIFDSIDMLKFYVDWKTIIRFVHEIISRVRTSGSRIILITSSEEESLEITRDLYIFVDRIINLAKNSV